MNFYCIKVFFNDEREKIEKAVSVLQLCDHPRIAKIWDFFIKDHAAHIIVDRDSNAATLDFCVQHFGWSLKEFLDVGIQLTDTLHYLQHLSPQPYQVTTIFPNGIEYNIQTGIKIFDFRLSALIPQKPQTILGCNGYEAMEVFAKSHYSEKSDIFLVGAILADFISGKSPHLYLPFSLSYGYATEELKQVSEEVEAVLANALAMQPEDRYVSLAELKSALEGLLESLPEEVLEKRVPLKK